jgi:carbon-monoxide dehydrogenase small subunit
MIMASVDLLRRHPEPTDTQIREGLAGNLCRCTGYVNIVEAVRVASQRMSGGQA